MSWKFEKCNKSFEWNSSSWFWYVNHPANFESKGSKITEPCKEKLNVVNKR